jgi:hypothetical protein
MIAYGNGNTQQYVGLSTDSKPTDAPNGSIYLEMNTGKIYFYNAAGEAWVEWSA